jgi:hypothetical protein
MATADRIAVERPVQARRQSRAMEKAVADVAKSDRVAASRVAERSATAARIAAANDAERQRRNAPQTDPSAERTSAISAQQQSQRPGAIVDLTA